MNKKKKITILVCTLFMVFSLGACGKTKEDAAVVTQQESSLQIESMDEETTSEESTTFNNGKEDDIELKDTIEIDFTYDYTEDIKSDVAYVVSNSSSLQVRYRPSHFPGSIPDYSVCRAATKAGRLLCRKHWMRRLQRNLSGR